MPAWTGLIFHVEGAVQPFTLLLAAPTSSAALLLRLIGVISRDRRLELLRRWTAFALVRILLGPPLRLLKNTVVAKLRFFRSALFFEDN